MASGMSDNKESAPEAEPVASEGDNGETVPNPANDDAVAEAREHVEALEISSNESE